MKIAICDDEQEFINKLKEKIDACFLIASDYNIEEFCSGEALINKYNQSQTPFDIIFLDIELGDLDGIEVAKFIRQRDDEVLIVFLTSHQEFAIKGYEVKAFRFILKSEPMRVFIRHLNEVFKEYSGSRKTLYIKGKERRFAIKIEDILYIEVFNRKVLIHTVNSVDEFYAKLADIENELSDFFFVKANKSYLVNLAHLEKIDNYNAVLKNGKIINISRRFKNAIDNAFVEFLIER